MTDRPRLTVVDDTPLHATPQPHDTDAERAILGACLTSRHAIDTASQHLTATDFYDRRHETIYAAIEHRYARLETVDQVSICDDLRTQLPAWGGQAFIFDLVMAPGALEGNTYRHALIVARLAAKRRLLATHLRGIQRALDTADTDTTPEQLLDAARHDLDQIPTTAPGTESAPTNTWAPIDLAGILANGETLEQPTQLHRNDGQHLLYPAAVHSISGEPESGKTWVALIAAAQTLRDPDGGHVTYVDFEDRAGRVVPRLVALGAPHQAILDRFHYIRPTAALDRPGRAFLDAVAAQSTLAVIDGVTEAMTMHNLSLLDNEDAARYLDLLPRHLADQGAAVLQIDHVVKDSEKQGRWAIGASHKLAGLDGAAYGIKVLDAFGRGKIGRAAIAIHKDRPGAVREIALGNAVAHLVIDSRHGTMAAWLEEPQSMPKSSAGTLRPTHLMEKVSRYIEMSPGASRRQIEEGITGKREYLRMAIDALVSEGYLSVTAGARGTQNHSIIAVYREGEE